MALRHSRLAIDFAGLSRQSARHRPPARHECGRLPFQTPEDMIDEAHLSAEPACPRTPPRFSCADGDRRWTQGDRRAPVARAQAPVSLTTLTRRADFLAANGGKRVPTTGFVLLVRPRGDDDATMRLGITVTRKIGNAVVRNRMKRRFRALARTVLPVHGQTGSDHVLIGRAGGVERDYAALETELATALAKARR
jgi:ribonuclease P protein component